MALFPREHGTEHEGSEGSVQAAGQALPKRQPQAKSHLLNELVALTGWHRDYARAALRQALLLEKPHPVRVGRKPTYPADLQPALVLCWAVLRAPASKLLAASMSYLVPMLRTEKALDITDNQAALLMRMSASTIDRRLGGKRAKMRLRGRSHTKPGSLLKSQIPIRTWAQWDDAVPGWTVNRSLRNKAQKWVFAALMHVTGVFPFPIIGIDSDNGSEFINEELKRYCEEQHITFTRSRPGNNNDGAHVEQKNWSRVRELVGYMRYDTPAELELLNQIWELDRIFTNYLLPQQKLVKKTRNGAKVSKIHDEPATSHRRAINHRDLRKMPDIRMNAAYKKIRVMALSRQILALTEHLETLAKAKGGTTTQHLKEAQS